MEEYYSHHHMKQVHHSGLVIGTLIGSCAVAIFIAISVVAANPSLLLHPLNLNSSISVQEKSSNNTLQIGAGATVSSSETIKPHGSSGSGSLITNSFSQR